jgi:hypothetical protein
MAEHTLNDYATDFVMQANRVLAIAEEVQQAVADDNLDGAYLVLGVSHGKLATLNEAMMDMQKRLEDAGADWERALGRK